MMTLSQQQQRAHDNLSAATVTTTTTRVAEEKNNATVCTTTTTTVDVVDAEYRVCYQFHIHDIQHMPTASKRWNTDLVLCQRYQGHHHHGSASSSSCEKGSDCWFIHADVSKAVNQWQVHVNYAWRDESEVTYERLPKGSQLLCVSAPNQRMPYEMCRRDLFLVTEGVTRRCYIPTTTPTAAMCGRKQGKVEVGGDERSYAVEEEEGLLVRNDHQGAVRRGEQRGGTTTGMTATVTHCAHFYFNRVCHRGSQCTYAHRITIDPTAMPGQRAPAPSVIPGTRAIGMLLNNDNNNYTTTTGQMNNAKIKISRKKYGLCDSNSTRQVNSSSRSCSTPHTAVDASSFNGTWLLLQQHNKSSSKITATTAMTTTTATTISGGSGTSSSMDDDTLRGDDSVESMTSVTDDGCCSFGSREDDADSFRVVPLEMTTTKTSSASLFATTGGGKLLLGTDGARFRHNPYLA